MAGDDEASGDARHGLTSTSQCLLARLVAGEEGGALMEFEVCDRGRGVPYRSEGQTDNGDEVGCACDLRRSTNPPVCGEDKTLKGLR